MNDACRHPYDERCVLCVSDTEFEAIMSGSRARVRLASTDQRCPTWLPEVSAA